MFIQPWKKVLGETELKEWMLWATQISEEHFYTKHLKH